MKKYTEEFAVIYKTNDYERFVNILGNRKVQDGNYGKLYHSMKERQMIIPILVNEKYQIVDGQHRFKICSELGLPVYYYKVRGYSIDDVKTINRNGTNWDIEDYLNMHKTLEDEGMKQGKSYSIFYEMMNKYKISLTCLLEVFTKLQDGCTMPEMRMIFEDGTFKAIDIDKVEDFLGKLQIFNQLKSYNKNTFVKAFLQIYQYEHYDHVMMEQKFSKLTYKLEKRTLKKEYVQLLIDDIYNYGTSKNKFKYNFSEDEFYTCR